jgi:TorA maturation chaperone TorD
LAASELASVDIGPDDAELARAGWYRLLATLLGRPPGHDVLDVVGGLEGGPTPFGLAIEALAAAARSVEPGALEREFTDLFIGVGEGELVPYGSYYMTGFLHERPLARLRADLRALGLARADGVFEPEDGIAGLCEAMAALIDGSLGAPAPLGGQRAFFEAHLAPWAARFFADLEGAPSADFYRRVGAVGHRFIALESEAFEISG